MNEQSRTTRPAARRPAEHISTEDLRATAGHEAEHTGERTRTRLRNADTNVDEFYINLAEVPEGSTYEWKRFSVHGQEDPFYLARMREQGFEPVDPAKHANWLPPGYNAPHIIKGGLILMERPTYLYQEARAEDREKANKQVIVAEQKLGKTPKDTMTRDYDGARPKIVKEVGRMVSSLAIED